MLPDMLAAHPRVTPQVLDVLTRCGTHYAATTALLRLQSADLPARIDLLGGNRVDVPEFLTHLPDAGMRRAVLNASGPAAWIAHLQYSPNAVADIPYIGRRLIEHEPDLLWFGVYEELVTHPDTPAGLVVELLNAKWYQFPVTSTLVLAALHNHRLHLEVLRLPLAANSRRRYEIENAVARYKEAGHNMSQIVNDHAPALAEYSSDTALVRQALEHLLSTPQRGAVAQVGLRAALGNWHLTEADRLSLIQYLYENNRLLDNSDHMVVAAALAALNCDVSPVLDAAVTLTSGDAYTQLLQCPQLQATHLYMLLGGIRRHPAAAHRRHCFLLLAAHPNVTDSTRERALTYAAASGATLPGQQALLSLARHEPLQVQDTPRDPDPKERQTFAGQIGDVIDRHPSLLTDPNVVAAALALAGTYQGPWEELIRVAEGVSA